MESNDPKLTSKHYFFSIVFGGLMFLIGMLSGTFDWGRDPQFKLDFFLPLLITASIGTAVITTLSIIRIKDVMHERVVNRRILVPLLSGLSFALLATMSAVFAFDLVSIAFGTLSAASVAALLGWLVAIVAWWILSKVMDLLDAVYETPLQVDKKPT